MAFTLSITKAELEDAGQITDLVNSAYRGEFSKRGWTTEADLLAGHRTDLTEIQRLISSNESMFLVAKTLTELAGTVLLQKQPEQVCLSMLAVNPLLQGKSIGKQLLVAAEQSAQQTWGVEKSVMEVISCREELIAFYQRRGYRRTGISRIFPVNPELWTPKVAGLRLETLEKML